MVANSSGRNHSARTFMVGTNSMDTPSPTSTRPVMAQARTSGEPRAGREPATATAKNTVIVRRGPQESESSPAGSCMAA